jgi:hypothetical protein
MIDAPIIEWSYSSAHDTAASCERERGRGMEAGAGILKKKDEGNLADPSLEEWAIKFLGARCVPYEIWWGRRR